MPRIIAGWRPQEDDPKDYPLMALGINPAPPIFPASIDLRRRFTLPVYDQRWNDCTANAACAYAGLLTRKALSRLYVYYETGVLQGDTQDDGRTCRDTIKTLVNRGAPEEKAWSYDRTHLRTAPPTTVREKALVHRVRAYYSCDAGIANSKRLNAIQAALAAGHPVFCGTYLPQGALSDATARTGIISYPADPQWVGGHAILLVGYNRANRQFTFRNSWGLDWGLNGYGFIDYKYAESGALRDCWVIQAEG